MTPQEKREIVAQVKDKFKQNACVVFSDFQGMNVASLQKLRQEIRRQGLELTVVKNTLIMKAADEFTFKDDIRPYLKGMTAVCWSREEPAAPVSLLKSFQKEDQKLKIKCGILDGKVLSGNEVGTLASFPTKVQLKAGLLALLTSPAQQFLALMQAPMTNFLALLENYRGKLEGK